jgi:hypothetical protein
MKRGNLILGGVLLLAGTLFLLETLDILRINVWGVIWALTLIVAGLWILGWVTYDRGHAETEDLSIPMEGAESARIKIRHGAGQLAIESGASPSEALAGKVSGGIEYQSSLTQGKLNLSLGAPGRVYILVPWVRSLHWTLQLNDQLPMALDLKTGGSESKIDLSQLKVSELDLNTGASDTTLTMPATVSHTRARVKGGVASLRIKVPEGVAARIRATGGLSEISIDRDRFPRSGGFYQSKNYDEAEFKLELDLSMGVGSMTVQ